jgi:hypothetical protein
MIKCQQCQKKFTQKNKRGIVPKFCSPACKQKHYRKTRTHVERNQPVQKSSKKTRNAPPPAQRQEKTDPPRLKKNQFCIKGGIYYIEHNEKILELKDAEYYRKGQPFIDKEGFLCFFFDTTPPHTMRLNWAGQRKGQ